MHATRHPFWRSRLAEDELAATGVARRSSYRDESRDEGDTKACASAPRGISVRRSDRIGSSAIPELRDARVGMKAVVGQKSRTGA